jgi:hypothetical protein
MLVREEVLQLKPKAKIMCCLVRATTRLRREDVIDEYAALLRL